MHQDQFPQNTNSKKGFKLLELRDKLARLNSPHRANPDREKLQRIYEDNKTIEAQISSLFDRISRHYYQSEECISQITRKAIASIQYHQSLLLKELDILKEKQLDAIKDDVERYLRHSKKIKKLMADCSINSSMEEEVKKIKPFKVDKLLQKIEGFQPESHKVDAQIELFKHKLNEFIYRLEHEPNKKSINQVKTPNILKVSGFPMRTSDISSFNDDYSRFLNRKIEDEASCYSKRREQDEDNLIVQTLEEQQYFQKDILQGDRKTQKWQERKQLEKPSKQSKKVKGKKLQKNSSMIEENDMKMQLHSIKPHSANNLEVRPEIVGIQKEKISQKMNNATRIFLEQLRKNEQFDQKSIKKDRDDYQPEILKNYRKTNEKNSETSTPQHQMGYIIDKNKNKSHRLNRIKSQQRLIQPLNRLQIMKTVESPLQNPSDEQQQLRIAVQNQLKQQTLKLSRFLEEDKKRLEKELGSVRSADFAKLKGNFQHSSVMDKSSRQREGKIRKGNWAQILKQQQANYNQVRRRIKN